ncbi:MAG TPA: MBL fold metallo-hydrolase [Candidatus Didemnitutus sp.]|jgi:glyoxylase-like metal-dependent hydrolase (beta-lactamase superfamily II)
MEFLFERSEESTAAFWWRRAGFYDINLTGMNATMPALEDELGDVIEKAARHARMSYEEVAAAAQVEVGRIQDAVDYRSELTTPELIRLARVLKLNEVGLGALAQGAYPRPEFGGLPFSLFPVPMPHGVGVTNAYLVSAGGNAALLFDTGASHGELHRAWPTQVDQIESVFVTHYEPEHIGGLDRVLAETGLPHFYGPANGRWVTCTGLGEGEAVEFMGLRVTAHSTPGHAPEHNCYTVGVAGAERPAVLISGDLIFAGSLGGGYFCCQRQLKHARRILELLDDDVVIAPGHGPLTTVGLERRFNPFLV